MNIKGYLKGLPWPNLITRSLVVNDILLLPIAVMTPNPAMLIYCCIRILIYISAEVLNFARRSRRYYIPGLQEMNEDNYWYTVAILLVVIKLLFRDEFVIFPPIVRLFEIFLVVVILVTILMKYQSQSWLSKEKEKRQKRISHLIHKTKLTNEEFQAIKSSLIEKGKEHQRQPNSLRLLLLLISLIIGVLLSFYAGNTVDWIENIEPLPHILPPN